MSENQKLREALRIFVGCATPVDKSIDERGHTWCEAYLDQALPIARQALALPTTEPTPATPEDMKVYNGIADNYSRSTHAQEPAKSVSVDCDGKPTAFVHWPLRGAPQLVWCSNQALGDAIRKAYEGYQPDLLLFTREALATQPAAQGLPDERALPTLIGAHPDWTQIWNIAECVRLARIWTGYIDITKPDDHENYVPQWHVVMAVLLRAALTTGAAIDAAIVRAAAEIGKAMP